MHFQGKGRSRKEEQQYRNLANAQSRYQTNLFNACPNTNNLSFTSNIPVKNIVICLMFISLFMFQSQAAGLGGNFPQAQDNIQQQSPSHALRVSHYKAVEAKEWLDRLNQEVWKGNFIPPQQQHTFEEFFGQLIQHARDGGAEAVNAFLDEAEDWGFALDSFYYYEGNNGSGTIYLRHLIMLNDLSENIATNAQQLIRTISNIKSIVSNNDVRSISQVTERRCFIGGSCFSNIPSLSINLEIPLTLCRNVGVDIERKHLPPYLFAYLNSKRQETLEEVQSEL
ncbi:MAG: hypothetical protein WC436_04525 [Candidatus Babeliales bacterium]